MSVGMKQQMGINGSLGQLLYSIDNNIKTQIVTALTENFCILGASPKAPGQVAKLKNYRGPFSKT